MESDQVNILGWYDHGNIGDEAYKLAFSTLFPENTFKFNGKLETSTDFCILGGGDVLGGYYLKNLNNAKRKIALSITVNEETNTKEHLTQFEQLFVRDMSSFETAKKLGGNPIYIPDLTFCLKPNKENGISKIQTMFEHNFIDLYERKIGIIINSNLVPSHDSTSRNHTDFYKFCADLAEFIDNYNASFIFIPFSTHMPTDDRIANGIIASQCKYWNKNLMIFDPMSVQDTLDVISACDDVISTRLHSSIFSCIAGVHFIDITHNHKNKNFLQTIQYDRTIPYRDFNKYALSQLLNINDETKQIITNNIKNITETQYNLLYEIKNNVRLL